MKFGIFCVSGLLLAAVISSAETRVLESFEGDGFGDWKVDGDGFGLAPVAGQCDGLTAKIFGFSGGSLACSAHGGDKGLGTLESPKFKLTEKYDGFLVAGGNHKGKTAVQLVVDGKVEMEATGEGSLNLKPVCRGLCRGRSSRIHIHRFCRSLGSVRVVLWGQSGMARD